ncbi:MAG TPA: ABC transporter permease [Pyrinomonadaceae bacterium]
MSSELSSKNIDPQAAIAVGEPTPGSDAEFGRAQSHLPDNPLIINRPEAESVLQTLHDFWQYRELLQFLTWRDIKIRYKQTVMGAAWAVLQPLLVVMVFAVFFGLFVGVPTDGLPYLVFYYSGILPWTFFANAVSLSSMSLIGNANLINKVYFPRVFIPTAVVTSGLVDLVIASLILLGFLIYFGFSPAWPMLMLPVYLLLDVLLALGLGIWIAALTVKYRDIRHALPFILQLWMFLTPIIYPLSVVPEKGRGLLFINPLTGIVEGMRLGLRGRLLSFTAMTLTVTTILCILGCGLYTFRRVERSMADVI